MTQYIVFREEFVQNTWVFVGHVTADDGEKALRQLFSVSSPSDQSVFGTYAAVPLDEYNDFVAGRTLQRIVPRIETVEPVEVDR